MRAFNPQDVPDHPVIRQMERTGEYRAPYEHVTRHGWFGMGPMKAGAVRVMTRAIMENLKQK